MITHRVIVIGTKSPGGIYTVITQHLDLLASTKYTSCFISSHYGNGFVNNVAAFISAFFKLLLSLLKNSVNSDSLVVHAHVSMRGSVIRKYILLLICRIFRVKYILHLHGSEIKDYIDNVSSLEASILKYLFTKSNKVVVLADSWKQYIDLKFSVDSFVLPNFIKEESTKKCVIESIERSNGRHKFSFFGALIDRKGCAIAIRAFNNLINSGRIAKSDFYFDVFGEGPLRSELEGLVASFDLSSVISFEGWVVGNDKQRKLLSTDTLILPSKNEGLPMVIIEAKSTGCAVISTDVGAISSMIKTGHGCLIAADSVIETENAILKMIGAGSTLKQIKLSNYNDYLERYTPAACRELLLEVYEC